MKRGQAALEFLMTYGWAILVVLVAISALAYFGVLSPDRSLPSSCILFPGLSCDDFKVDSSGVVLIVRNGLGKDLESLRVVILGDDECGGESSSEVSLEAGNDVRFNISCSEKPVSGSKFKRELLIEYREVDGLEHSKRGDLSTRVE